ncbi:MAG: hypothetical protein R2845_09360 [Thermomicrobiales bacterium]
MDRPRVRIAGLEQWLLGFQQFVIRRYAELEDAFAPTVVDLEHARDRLEGFGLELGKMLFPEELVEELWDHRESIGPIHLRSFEPYVPWELVRLWNFETVEDAGRPVSRAVRSRAPLFRRFGAAGTRASGLDRGDRRLPESTGI